MRSRPKKRRRKPGGGSKSRGRRVSHWAKSDTGLKREMNEDSYLADSNLGLYIVADGMGGHAGGDTASRMAVSIVRQEVIEARNSADLFSSSASEGESEEMLKRLGGAIKKASAAIYEASSENPELEGMGTTVTMMLTHGGMAYIGHVGDSRLYRMREGEMELLSEDHSLVNEQIKAGFLTEEEAANSRFRNIITRSVGFESEVTADTFSVVMQSEDIFLICSDGLNGMVDDHEIAKTMRRGNLSTLPARLINAANKMGGEDNITVIVMCYGQDGRRARSSKRTSKKGHKKGQKKGGRKKRPRKKGTGK